MMLHVWKQLDWSANVLVSTYQVVFLRDGQQLFVYLPTGPLDLRRYMLLYRGLGVRELHRLRRLQNSLEEGAYGDVQLFIPPRKWSALVRASKVRTVHRPIADLVWAFREWMKYN